MWIFIHACTVELMSYIWQVALQRGVNVTTMGAAFLAECTMQNAMLVKEKAAA